MNRKDALKQELDKFNGHVVGLGDNPLFRKTCSEARYNVLLQQSAVDRYRHLVVHPKGRVLKFDTLRDILIGATPRLRVHRCKGSQLPSNVDSGSDDSNGCSDSHEIWIKETKETYFESTTLLHEYIHVIDHHSAEGVSILDILGITADRLLKHEVIAESASYLAAKYLGLEREGSIEYVGNYLHGITGGLDREQLDKYSEHIVDLADLTIGRVQEGLRQLHPMSA